MRLEKSSLDVDMKSADMRLLILIEELKLLQQFEEGLHPSTH